MGARALFGRRVIYTDVAEINAGNIIDVLQKALFVHLQNSADIDYLYRYYRGDQPVLYREKEVRPEICNKVVENRANEIVSFKVGYLMGEPVQYVSRSDDESISAEVSRLNDYVLSEDSHTWWHLKRTHAAANGQAASFGKSGRPLWPSHPLYGYTCGYNPPASHGTGRTHQN